MYLSEFEVDDRAGFDVGVCSPVEVTFVFVDTDHLCKRRLIHERLDVRTETVRFTAVAAFDGDVIDTVVNAGVYQSDVDVLFFDELLRLVQNFLNFFLVASFDVDQFHNTPIIVDRSIISH